MMLDTKKLFLRDIIDILEDYNSDMAVTITDGDTISIDVYDSDLAKTFTLRIQQPVNYDFPEFYATKLINQIEDALEEWYNED